MSRETLIAKLRTAEGTNSVKKLRRTKCIPGVLYGHHIDAQSIQLDEPDFEKFIGHHNIGASLDLDINGEKTFVVLKDIQKHAVRHSIIHVEFQALSAGERIKIKVPLIFSHKDTVPAGLIVEEMHHEIELSILPKDLFESVEVNLTGVQIGDSLRISDLDISKNTNFDILDDIDTILYSISEPAMHVESGDEDNTLVATEVPVIGAKEE